MKTRLALALVAAVVIASRLGAADPSRVFESGKRPADQRLGKAKTLDDYFPFTPPTSKDAWEARRQVVREQVQVATGLWPLPKATPLNAVIHGKIDRDDYTIEKVFFASYPGHYVSGNLYRPKGKTGKVPGVLCPHGHWPDGRFYDLQQHGGDAAIKRQLELGAEKTVEGARFPLQARCAMLARMGCVVFHYDMVGYADSQQIPHRQGFLDAQAELRQQSFMGLQTYNSVRSLDFLLSLPEVDPARIGVTGASGGGTQTFILTSVDDRPSVAFPAVMVSTAMQGGCICENCSYLRVGTGNIELAGLFAPKPLGMSAANDWTKEIMTKGYPELQALYRLYGAEDRVLAKAFLQFDHNYNQVSREVMYNWFNQHLHLGQPTPVVEKPFVPVPPKELSVYDAAHPRPADAVDAAGLRKYLTASSEAQMQALIPHDAASAQEYRRVVGTALRTMIGGALPTGDEVEARHEGDLQEFDGFRVQKLLLGRKGAGEEVPAIAVLGADFDGAAVVWIHPQGKASLFKDGKLVPAAQQIIDKKGAILAPDVFGTGELTPAQPVGVNPNFAGFTFGYNRSLLANRVHDILTAIAFAKNHPRARGVLLVGHAEAGPWALIARSLAGDAVDRTAVDLNQFRFENIKNTSDEMMLPGALKYGGLAGLAALAAPAKLFVHHSPVPQTPRVVTAMYQASGAADKLRRQTEAAQPEAVIQWLMR